MGIIKVNLIIMPLAQTKNLCTRAYYNHKYGCPNFNKKNGCPPSMKRFDEKYDITKNVYAIYNIFPFGDHVRRMKILHPEWSQRQAECCLYWQGKARKHLDEQICYFGLGFVGDVYGIERVPEAMGVNVTLTMADAGIMLEWPPKIVTYQIALVAFLKEPSQ